MKRALLTLTVALFVVSSAAIAEAASQSPEMKVLNRWLGSWKSHAVLKPSAWIPGGAERTEIRSIEWILDGHFQQTTARGDEKESREINRFDPLTRVYQKWTFDANGNAGYWTGTWNESANTMTWSFDVGFLKGKMVDCFVAADKCETTVIIKDGGGTLLLDARTEHKRIEK